MENKLLTPMPLSPFTKTVGATGVSATQITVEDITAFPVPNAGEEGVAILCAVKEFYSNDPSDFETVTYTGITGSTLTGVTRAVEGTAKSWVAGTTIACMFVAEYIKRINAELNSKVDSTRVLSDVPVNAKFTDTVYTHPTKHPASIITQDANNRFVTDTEKTTWNAKETPAGAQTKVDTHKAEEATLAQAGHVKHATLSTTLNTAWSGGSAPFTKVQTISGILATDTPIIDVVMSGTFATDEARQEAWGYVYRAVTSANAITFYATEKPAVELPIQIKVVR